MKVGLYFGSFNPIHHGHLIIANYLLQNSDLDQVWLVVSPQNPFKQSASLLNSYNRLNLVQLAIEGESKLKASDIEFRLPQPSYTVNTLAYLQEKYPTHQFAIIMGSDSFENLAKWKNYEFILQHCTIYVYRRPGHEVIRRLGGLHRFMGWNGPILTDSGGYQVLSLGAMRKLSEEGVNFQSHLDGASHLLTPEKSIEIQQALGSDIIMVLDECISGDAPRQYVQLSTERTVRSSHRRA